MRGIYKYQRLAEVPGVARGILKTLFKKILFKKNFFSLCYPQGSHGFSQKVLPAFCPAITNIYIYERRALIYRLFIFLVAYNKLTMSRVYFDIS